MDALHANNQLMYQAADGTFISQDVILRANVHAIYDQGRNKLIYFQASRGRISPMVNALLSARSRAVKALRYRYEEDVFELELIDVLYGNGWLEKYDYDDPGLERIDDRYDNGWCD